MPRITHRSLTWLVLSWALFWAWWAVEFWTPYKGWASVLLMFAAGSHICFAFDEAVHIPERSNAQVIIGLLGFLFVVVVVRLGIELAVESEQHRRVILACAAAGAIVAGMFYEYRKYVKPTLAKST